MNPSERIDALIAGTTDWRGETLAALRKAILDADKGIEEDWKWKGSPVWSCDGMIAVANAHKDKVKITFMHGAKLADPDRLFNAGLGGGAWRAIDFLQGDKVDKRAVRDLVRAAIAYNQSALKKNAPRKVAAKKAVTKTAAVKKVVAKKVAAKKTVTSKSTVKKVPVTRASAAPAKAKATTKKGA